MSKKNKSNIVYSTNSNFNYDDDEEEYVGVGIVESLIFGMSWSALRKALSSFVVTLVQCGENGKEESKTWIRAVGILHHLIVECKNELEDCFAFIPNISSSAASLSEISRTLKESRSSVTFEERVRQLVIVAEHESVAVSTFFLSIYVYIRQIMFFYHLIHDYNMNIYHEKMFCYISSIVYAMSFYWSIQWIHNIFLDETLINSPFRYSNKLDNM